MTIDSYPHTDQEKDWFWGIGATNYHPEFKESERLIDKEINEPLGNMFPDWKKPETFKDWSDDYKIWDLWLMLGRDINEKSSWFIEMGGMTSDIDNSKTYLSSGVPIDVDVDFSRTEAFVLGVLSYYPWGKPSIDKTRYRILCAKPYGEISIGYVYIEAAGEVKLSSPPGLISKQKERRNYDLFQVSPRVGVEIPMTENDSVSFMGCYSFFNNNESEFNSPSFSIIYKHRF